MDTCCVADQFCTSPANLEPNVPARGTCYRCGEAVCRECSTRIPYPNNIKVRVCNNCQRELGREDWVLLRIYHKAGYPLMTITAVRKELAAGRQEYPPRTLRDEVIRLCMQLSVIAKQAKDGEDAALRDHVLGIAKELRRLCGKRR